MKKPTDKMILIDMPSVKRIFNDECATECDICIYYKSDDEECHCGLLDKLPFLQVDLSGYGTKMFEGGFKEGRAQSERLRRFRSTKRFERLGDGGSDGED